MDTLLVYLGGRYEEFFELSDALFIVNDNQDVCMCVFNIIESKLYWRNKTINESTVKMALAKIINELHSKS